MLRDSVVVVRTRPRAIPLAMITMRKSTHGLPFVSHMSMGLRLNGGSSSNPILYCWNIEVRQAVKNTIRQVLCHCFSSNLL